MGQTRMESSGMPSRWGRIFLPFALGYYLSYLLRTVNAVISPALTAELDLSAANLGLLTSTYFLAFGLAQIPVGIALDRFGPRRVEALLLLITAIGAAMFALGDSLQMLGFGRALIGLGVSACLMAALKGFALWYPRERQSSMTGFIMASGALGALTASTPLEALLPVLGWRGAFWIICVVALLASFTIFRSLPDAPAEGPRGTLGDALRVLGGIYASPAFLRLAASAATFIGGFMALQSLWAVPWLMNVNELGLAQAAGMLVVLNLGTLVGWCLMGFGAVGLIGNSLGGRMVDRHPLIASMVFCAFMIGGLVALVPSIHSTLGLAAAMGIWGVTQAAMFLVSHVRLMKVAPHAPAFAASLNIAGANLGIGLGAMVGGRVIDSYGLGNLGFAAAGFILVSILLALVLMTAKAPPVCASAG